MKIKYNIPMLNEIKNRIGNMKSKIENNKENRNKVPIKYYTLLLLMLVIGLVTFSSNIKMYSDMNAENYIKYNVDDTTMVDSNKVENVQYETAISSISTNVSNMDDKEEISNNESRVVATTSKKYIYPVEGDVIKDYAMDTLTYSKTLDMWKVHPGMDIKAEFESEVVAVQDGKIVAISHDNFYGNTIKIEHEDGYMSVYSNLDNVQDVVEGEMVKQGDVIGKIGVSAYGEIADESHLHFELLKNSEWVNPLEILE